MKKLRIVLRYLAQPLAQPWRRRNPRPPKVYPVLSVDPEEFSSLLGSGGGASVGCVIVVAVFEAPAVVTGLDDVTVVGQAVEPRGPRSASCQFPDLVLAPINGGVSEGAKIGRWTSSFTRERSHADIPSAL
jgi:hypothetical protein